MTNLYDDDDFEFDDLDEDDFTDDDDLDPEDNFDDDAFDDDDDDDDRIIDSLLNAQDIVERDLAAIQSAEDLPPGYHIESADSPTYDDEVELLEIEEIAFAEALEALRNPDYELTAPYLRAVSDLSASELQRVHETWPHIAPNRRVAILERLLEMGAIDWSIDGLQLAEIGLSDQLGAARACALGLLAEECPPALVTRVVNLLASDPEARVRSAAAGALAQFAYQYEMETISATAFGPIETALLNAAQNDDSIDVRRRALEAVGFLDRPDIRALILNAYETGPTALKASALKAMAYSLNPADWQTIVLHELQGTEPAITFQAIYAAGELQLKKAVPHLLPFLASTDIELRDSAIWALGEIGGKRAREALQALMEVHPDDQDLLDIIDDAIANIDLEDALDIDDSLHWSNVSF